jgi:hypothetical protein
MCNKNINVKKCSSGNESKNNTVSNHLTISPLCELTSLGTKHPPENNFYDCNNKMSKDRVNIHSENNVTPIS